uniref:Uncharacterized protein n=1 Tax=Suricata suricatta TaxID=37032 RepID=A0A673UL97_SURSU
RAAAARGDPAQVAAVEHRMRMHPLKRVFLVCHRPARPRQLCLPRRPTPVRCVVRS